MSWAAGVPYGRGVRDRRRVREEQEGHARRRSRGARRRTPGP
ncbi:hypothetical protein SLI_2634 [Streptomyces lividans 1326]|uniref:Uncharacterized protein n=1 Tax=Streptomyces lividans 1326 TaxID=1200984 RepID=A0A7U9HAS7_STRLI|nr:hypothetical protein SLI_2634 [Streptomyces lividans 1326]